MEPVILHVDPAIPVVTLCKALASGGLGIEQDGQGGLKVSRVIPENPNGIGYSPNCEHKPSESTGRCIFCGAPASIRSV